MSCSKEQKVSSQLSTNFDNLNVASGGINDTLKSQFYQVKLLILFLLRSKDKPDFQLATEIVEAQKFDDIIVNIPNCGFRFLQAKLKLRPTKLNFASFFTDKNYDLQKYYQSFLSLKKKFAVIIDVIICTNNLIEGWGKNYIELKDGPDSIFFEKVQEDDEVFGSSGSRFKFSMRPIEKIQTRECLKEYFKVTGNSADLEEFMSKFMLVLDFKDEDFYCEISPILQKDFNMQNVNFIDTLIQGKFVSWVQSIGSNDNYFDSAKLENLYDDIKAVFATQKLMNFVSYTFDGKNMLEFKNINQDLIKFFENPSDSLSKLLVITKPEETILATNKCYQILKTKPLDTFLILQTGLSAENFKSGIEIFVTQSSFQFLVVECNDGEKQFLEHRDQIMEVCQKDQKKRLVVIADQDITSEDSEFFKILEEQVTLGDLTAESMNLILQKEISFQSVDVKLEELLNSNNKQTMENIKLSEIKKLESIGSSVINSKSYDSSLYIPRTLIHQIKIKKHILDDRQILPNEELAFNEEEFESLCKIHAFKNIHLLEDPKTEFLLWRKSRGVISELKKYSEIDAGIELSECSVIESLESRVLILVDVAGKGKSSFLNHTSCSLKEKWRHLWIVNIALNNYTNFFMENELDDEEIVFKFLAEIVLNLKSSLEMKLFREACFETGNVVVLLDGLDEVAPDYGDKVIRMTELMLQMKVKKIYISTRPELGEVLEDKFQQMKYFLLTFKKTDQVTFLVNYWKKYSKVKKDQVLAKIADEVINNINISISDHEKSFTGIPLISRLVAEIMNHHISAENSSHETYVIDDLFHLFCKFIDGKFKIYLEEKLNIDISNVQMKKIIENEDSTIRKLYQKFALRKNLKFDEIPCIPYGDVYGFSPEILQTLRKCGMIAADDQFIHKTFGEHFFLTYMIEHLGIEQVAKLFFNSVLITRRHNVVRTFFNYFLKKELKGEKADYYRSIVRKHYPNIRSTESVLYLTTWEQNIYIFDFLFISLIQNPTPDQVQEIEKFLVTEFSILRKYFMQVDDELNILEQIQVNVGTDVVKKILQSTKFGFAKRSLLTISLEKGRNVLRILQWLKVNYQDDSIGLNSILNNCDENGSNFLHTLLHRNTEGSKDEVIQLFFMILAELQELKKSVNSSQSCFLESLILSKNSDGKSLLHLMVQKRVDASSITGFLSWVQDNFSLDLSLQLLQIKDKGKKLFWSELLCKTEPHLGLEKIKEYFKEILKWLGNQYPNEIPEDIQLFHFMEKVAKQDLAVVLPTNDTEENFKSEISVLTHFSIIQKSGKKFIFNDPEYYDFFGAFYILEVSDMKFGLILNLVKELQYTNLLRIVNQFILEKPRRKSLKSSEIFKQNEIGYLFLNLAQKDLGNIYNHFLDLLLITSDPQENLNLIRQIVFTKNKHGFSSLHIFSGIDSSRDVSFISTVLDKLNYCNDHLGKDFTQEYLQLKTHDGKIFLHFISTKEFFKSMLDFVELHFGEDSAKQLLLSKDQNGNLFLFYLFMREDLLEGYLRILKQKFGSEFLKELLLTTNNCGQNFLYSFEHAQTYSNSFKVIKLLNFLHSSFGLDESLFKNLLSSEDTNGTTFLQHFVLNCKLFNTRNKKLIEEKKTRIAYKNVVAVWLKEKFQENFTKNFPQMEKSNKQFVKSLKLGNGMKK